MTPRGPDDDTRYGDLPDPPYSAETLADYHAGALSDPVAAHVRAQIANDRVAQSILAGLDRTVADLRASGPEMTAVPDPVRADVEATLAALAGSGQGPTVLDARRRVRESPSPQDRRMSAGRWLAAAAAVLVVVAGSVGIFRMVSSPDASPPQARPATAQPTPDPVGAATALSVLGRTDGAPFGSVAALRRCTAAHLIPVRVVIVGSGPITVRGTPAAAILMSTGVAGRFDALIVGVDCDTGNPAFISRSVIGG
ncbi:hypothetical protein [Gordonia sp. 'Campus']|uniref:hypothetical protein n=1 Tax=Gordonia sp. 'Campus' TaxID=2915824 RepID=UPI001EE4E0BF|nr:hypothetical protein [Gordonia sp. 'Campus']